MARRLNNDPLDGARDSLRKLRAADDWNEATPVVHVNVQPPPPRTPAPPPPRTTDPSKLRIVVAVFQRFPPWGAVIVAIVLILAWAYLAAHGKAPVP